MTEKVAVAVNPHGLGRASDWVERFLAGVPDGGVVLDIACGAGRHLRRALERGHAVVGLDRDVSGLADLAGRGDVEILAHDLEAAGGLDLPTAERRFGGVIVTNYLFRPLLTRLAGLVAPDGILIYETFARGQERFGKPSNPDFLLAPGELLEAVRGRLRVVAYEDLVVDEPRPAAIQRLCARREDAA